MHHYRFQSQISLTGYYIGNYYRPKNRRECSFYTHSVSHQILTHVYQPTHPLSWLGILFIYCLVLHNAGYQWCCYTLNNEVDCPSKPVHTASIIRKLTTGTKCISLAQFLCMFLAIPQFHNNQFITLKNLLIAKIHRDICRSFSFPATVFAHF